MSRTTHQVPLLVEFLEGENHGVRLESVLVEWDSKVRVASVRNELIGDVGDVIITGSRFLRAGPGFH